MRNKKSISLIISLISVFIIGLSFVVGFLIKSRGNIINGDSIQTGVNASVVSEDATIEEKGGAIYVEPGSSYTMFGGTLGGKEATYGGGVFVSNGATFIMKGGTIKGGSAKYGGAIFVENGGKCIIDGGEIDNCSATDSGGGIFVDSEGILEFNSGTITNCSSSSGGGLYLSINAELTTTINNATITNNTATFGAGVCTFRDINLTNSTINSNTADTNGGGIYIEESEVNINDTTFSLNKATGIVDDRSTGLGGGIYVCDTGRLTYNGGEVSNCSSVYGGGLYLDPYEESVIKEVCITNNTATYGAGIYTEKNIKMDGCEVNSNKAVYTGGGLHVESGVAKLDAIYMSSNETETNDNCYGGGIYINSTVDITINSGIIQQCKSTKGGGIYLGGNKDNSTIVFNNLNLTNNIAEDGAGLFTSRSIELNKCLLNENEATHTGAGLYINQCVGLFKGTSFSYNKISSGTGGTGAGIQSINCTLTFSDSCAVNSNVLETSEVDVQYGAGIFVNGGYSVINLNSVSFIGNSMKSQSSVNGKWITNRGAAIYASGVINIGQKGNSTPNTVKFSENHADHGGCILSYGATINIYSCLAENNTAGYGAFAYFSSNTPLTIDGSYSEETGYSVNIRNNTAVTYGGGLYLYSGAKANINNAEISDNEAKNGGGIYLENSSLTMKNSLLDGNVSNMYRESYGEGGALYLKNAKTNTYIENTTITNNKARLRGGGIYLLNGTHTIKDSIVNNNRAISGSGGGIYSAANLILENTSIDQNNSSDYGGGLYLNSETCELKGTTSISSNYSSVKSAGGIYVGSTLTMSEQGNVVISNNRTGSAAVNDIVGVDIYVIEGCSLTLYGATMESGSTQEYGSSIYNKGTVILKNVTMIKSNSEQYSNCGGAIYNETGATLQIGDNSTISGFKADNNGGAIYNNGGIFTSTGGLTINNCSAVNGGAIYNIPSDSNTLSLAKITAESCIATENGGAIYNYNSSVDIGEGTFNNCSAIKGGAIYNDSSIIDILNIAITKLSVDGCTATDNGGAIYNFNYSMQIGEGTVNNCSAVEGGALYSEPYEDNVLNIAITKLYVDNCTATGNGGAIYNYNSVLTIGGGTIENCSAVNGGALYNCAINNNATINITGEFVIDNCTATNNGGAICNPVTQNENTKAVVTISGVSQINDCSAVVGGAIFNEEELTISELCTITECLAQKGAGIWLNSSKDTCVANIKVHIKDCDSTIANGGGIYLGKAQVTLNSSIIEGCSTTANGGGIYVSANANIDEINGCEFKNNSAVYGGGVYLDKAVNFTNTKIDGNTAQHRGGGLYISANCSITFNKTSVSSNTLINGNTDWLSGWGAGIYHGGAGTLTFNNGCQVNSNVSSAKVNNQYGAGIYGSQGSIINFNSIEIKGNILTSGKSQTSGDDTVNRGGAIYTNGSVVNFGSKGANPNLVTISENIAYYGGGIATYTGASGGTINFYSCVVNGNRAYLGGGMWLTGTTQVFFDGTYTETYGYSVQIKENMAVRNGAAALFGSNTTTINIKNTEFSNNTTDNDSTIDSDTSYGAGGGITIDGATVTMESGSLSNNQVLNKTSLSGGGVYLRGGTFNLQGGTISNNILDPTKENSMGGNIYIDADAVLNFSGGTISGDGKTVQAKVGGGIANNGILNITGGTIESCVAIYAGGVASFGGFHLKKSILGIYNFDYDLSNNMFNMSGNPIIQDNVAEIGSAMSVGHIINLSGSPTIQGDIAVAASETVKFLSIYTLLDSHYPTINVIDTFTPTNALSIVLSQAKIAIEDYLKNRISYTLSTTQTLLTTKYITNGEVFVNHSAVEEKPSCDLFIVNEGQYGHINKEDGIYLTDLETLTLQKVYNGVNSEAETIVGGEGCVLTVFGTVLYRDYVEVYTAEIDAGYRFDGYYDEEDNKLGLYTLTGGDTIYLKFVPVVDITINVSYDGRISTNQTKTITVDKGTTINVSGTKLQDGTTDVYTATAAYRYEFKGFYDSSGTIIASFTASSEQTITAKFETKKVTLKIIQKLGETDSDTNIQEFEVYSEITVSGNTLKFETITIYTASAVDLYQFEGFYNSSGTKITSSFELINSQTTITAKYSEVVTLTIAEAYGGYTLTTEKTVVKDSTITVSENTLKIGITTIYTASSIYDGYNFSGFYNSSGSKITSSFTVSTATRITAKFTEEVEYVTLTIKTRLGETVDSTKTKSVAKGSTITVDGYTLKKGSTTLYTASSIYKYVFEGFFDTSGNSITTSFTINTNKTVYADYVYDQMDEGGYVTSTVTVYYTSQSLNPQRITQIETDPYQIIWGDTFSIWWSGTTLYVDGKSIGFGGYADVTSLPFKCIKINEEVLEENIHYDFSRNIEVYIDFATT